MASEAAAIMPDANLREELRTHGVGVVRRNVAEAYGRDPARYEQLALRLLHWLWAVDRREAAAEAACLDALSPGNWPQGYRGVVRFERIRRLVWLGEYGQARALLQELPAVARTQLRDLEVKLDDYAHLADADDPVALIEPPHCCLKPTSSKRPRILYFAHHALPYHANGYAHRTASLVGAIAKRGWDIRIATRVGFPVDREIFGKPLCANLVTRLDVSGIDYLFNPSAKENLSVLPPLAYLRAAALRLAQIIEREGIDLVHAASNYVCGLAAVAAARACGIPCVYEARGAWEVTRASRDPDFAKSDAYHLDLRLERAAAAAADRFMAINTAVGSRYAINTVTRKARAFGVVPNGIELSGLAAESCTPPEARAELNLPQEAVVIGYAGSLVDYEGLDLVIRALALLRHSRAEDVRLLTVGDGFARPLLENMARHLGLTDRVMFVGRVERDRLPRFYAAMDVVCVPRRAWPVCELVTPLKPFEAMAAGLPVIASSVAPLREAIETTGGGLVFEKDNIDSLLSILTAILDAPDRLRHLGEKGKQAVEATRRWDSVVKPVDVAYRSLLPVGNAAT